MTSDTRTVRARRFRAQRQQNDLVDRVPPTETVNSGDPTLAELGIPARYHDDLQSAGIETLADLEQAGDLTNVKGIGPKASAEIAAAVAAYRG